MSDYSPSVFVFCALACEARPLIQAWQLKKLATKSHPFIVYASAERLVVITGVGKLAMAGAVGYVMGLFSAHHQSPILLNLGIAGHRNYPLGTVCLAHKIVDVESGRCFFPQLPFTAPCATLSLVTHAQPHVDYVGDDLYDMEAAGFYEMAVKFNSSELIHVMKVVSDNADSSIANINESLVEGWIGDRLNAIEALLVECGHLQRMLQSVDSALYQQFLGQFHFSVSNALKLKALILRWRLLRGDEVLALPEAGLRGAKEMIAWIENQLDETEFCL